MEKTNDKIRYGLIGIGAQGSAYARFLTNGPSPSPELQSHRARRTAHWVLCAISTPKKKRCAKKRIRTSPSSRIGRK